MHDIVIHSPDGGLGDNLQFSTLPELYTAKGHDVYIHQYNVVRNPEIHDLVWGCNPYIKGYSQKTPNCGLISGSDKHECVVANWEIEFGFGPVHKYPKIYYPCKPVNLQNKVLIDLSYVSNNFDNSVLGNVRELLSTIFSGKEVVEIDFKTYLQTIDTDAFPMQTHFGYASNASLSKFSQMEKGLGTKPFVFKNKIPTDYPKFVVQNIFEFCDAINSSFGFISLMSGGAVLASAIKQDKEYPLIYTLKHEKDTTFLFENINYINV